jgi:superfamily II DNA or RNA helicase
MLSLATRGLTRTSCRSLRLSLSGAERVRYSISASPKVEKEKEAEEKINRQQQLVIDTLKHSNVVLSARPGCGKTKTAIKAIAQNPGRRILFLTYTRNLREKFAEEAASFDNVTVKTFHESVKRVIPPLILISQQSVRTDVWNYFQ